MSYFAAAVVRDGGGWTAAEVNLRGATDVDEVADRLRDVEPDADLSLLFVEADDAYLVVLRLDEGEDLRVFGSDSAYAEESRLGALLVGDLKGSVTGFDDTEEPRASAGSDDDSEQPAVDPEADPVGDADLLADLGISAQRLLRLCAHEGMLPADVTAEVCQVLGCADEVEELRGV
ncbi:tRNA adenosine deaminase-associated protein [Micromonospora carbonacea]|uniref:tRNA adenosine deaminase-associated protein n=1 Tax=Micromonospora carbonacea TaxID=47853 RepID=A0A7H8XU01_9ACTN|nr:tRNA adenosine deaminase-associated protein [Micromonospora carbonacea]MBB5823825.1 putative tRNA adenosine deaminase-associated protein [Micromonospora carbonacea]QLD27888.1 tRNA adenosine deaminase-associated protein [Micromonospora carbonacea]